MYHSQFILNTAHEDYPAAEDHIKPSPSTALDTYADHDLNVDKDDIKKLQMEPLRVRS